MRPAHRKGIRLIFRNRLWGVGGDVHEPGDVGGGSGKSYLFLLTVGGPGKQVNWRTGARAGRAGRLRPVRCALDDP